MEVLAAWIAAIAAVGALIVTVRYRSKDKEQAAMDAIVERQDSQAAALTELSKSQERLMQRMDDHEEHDTARFDDIAGMFKEIRQDVKALLRGARDV